MKFTFIVTNVIVFHLFTYSLYVFFCDHSDHILCLFFFFWDISLFHSNDLQILFIY